MTRFNRWCLSAFVLLAAAASAIAGNSGPVPGGSELTIGSKLWLHENNSTDLVQPEKTPDSLWHYFNLAHCVCSQPSAAPSTFKETSFSQEIDSTSGTPLHRPLEIWVGTSCDDTIMRPMNCHKIDAAGIADIASIQTTSVVKPEVPVFDLMTPEPNPQGCEQRVLSATEWGISDTDGDGVPDYFISQAIDTDALPPPLPASFTALGAENAIQISWTAASGDVADIAYYQALCSTDLGNPAKTKDVPAPRYQTARLLCGTPLDVTLKPSDIATTSALLPVDGGVDAPDAPIDAPAGTADADLTDAADEVVLVQGMAQLDPTFLCGEVDDATATSMRIEGLQNGQKYTVILLAIDKFGNAAGTYFTSKLTPKPVTDFWEDLEGRCTGNDCPEGGFCLLAETYGDGNPLTQALRSFRDDNLASTALGRWLTTAYYATLAKLGAIVHGHWWLRIISGVLLLPLVAFALLWHLLTLPGLLAVIALLALRRRSSRSRRARLATAATAAFVIMLAPGRARAQSPYWEDETHTSASDSDSLADRPAEITWHAGIRGGPYIPQIDAQIGGMSPGPYEQMFGGSKVLPVLDVDRFLWNGFGQLGVGLSIGYFSQSAHAWEAGSSPTDPKRPRSSGDTNSFHLVPLAVTAVYRLTYFDDEYGVPFVPYVRGGLAYYPWWISAPNGNFATACPAGSTAATCPMTTAAGASLGVTGSVGLAIRAERIDAAAAHSMQQGGIEHAGFYAELSAAKVDGLGIAHHKLSVGDATWFVGVDFEF